MNRTDFDKLLYEAVKEYEPAPQEDITEITDEQSFDSWKKRNHLSTVTNDNDLALRDALLEIFKVAESYGDTTPLTTEESEDTDELTKALNWANNKTILKSVKELGLDDTITDEQAADMIERYKLTSKSFHNLQTPSIPNSRDVGGYPTKDGRRIKRGKLLRTAYMGDITPEDLAKLEALSLSDIMDFRTELEAETSIDPEMEGVTNSLINIMNDDFLGGSPVVKDMSYVSDPLEGLLIVIENDLVNDEMYADMVANSGFKTGYRKFFDILLNKKEEDAVLWHCSAGKDRTGIATVLLMSVLGVENDLIVQEYLLTNDFFFDQVLAAQKYARERYNTPEEDVEKILYVLGSHQNLLKGLKAKLEEKYGGMDNFLYGEDGLNLTEKEVKKLKDLYLE